MAIHMMEISGKIANVVFYKMYGKNFVRSAPKKTKRSKAMKQRNRNFGVASRSGRLLRLMLHEAIPFPKNRSMQSRFSGAISKWMGNRNTRDIGAENNIAQLADFQFNDHSSIRKSWKINPLISVTAQGNLRITIPAFVPIECFLAPANAVSASLVLITASCNLEKATPGESFPIIFDFDLNNRETGKKQVDIPIKMEPGTFMVTVCSLVFSVKTKNAVEKLEDPAFLPSSVIDARYF